jgi:hypothetical protein
MSEMTGGAWMNPDQRESVRQDAKSTASAAEVCRRIRDRLPKWRAWFPDEGSMVEVPRRELLALVAAAEQRDALLAALKELADAGAEAWGEDRPCVRVALGLIVEAEGGE